MNNFISGILPEKNVQFNILFCTIVSRIGNIKNLKINNKTNLTKLKYFQGLTAI